MQDGGEKGADWDVGEKIGTQTGTRTHKLTIASQCLTHLPTPSRRPCSQTDMPTDRYTHVTICPRIQPDVPTDRCARGPTCTRNNVPTDRCAHVLSLIAHGPVCPRTQPDVPTVRCALGSMSPRNNVPLDRSLLGLGLS